MKSKGWIIALSVLGVLVLLLVLGVSWWVGTYNKFVKMDEEVNAGWSQVQNQYQRRLDLIPNLVETVKGYAKHESETLEGVIKARSEASKMVISPEVLKDPQAFQMFEKAQGQLSSALSRLMVVVEKYPDLKANENFLQLQSQLEGTENRITVERQRFNEVVRIFNTAVKTIPASIVAGMSGFTPRAYFQAQAGAESAPKVKF